MIHLEDTIVAIATPLGEGGLAVIRVSGPDSIRIVGETFVPEGNAAPSFTKVKSHTIHYGHILCDGNVVDEVMVAVMRAPRTFTREDVVEVTCHGGILPPKAVLDVLLKKGARLAEPGEFSRRAFLNGRFDLTQAEAIADLIHSRTELALRSANEQLAGKLSQRINLVRDDAMRILAHVEAHIDFPDEDISPDTREQLQNRIKESISVMEALLRTATEGQILRRGIRAVILGRPNAGKSSLLNQLLGNDRAIVSPIAGTTRDTIEETANIRGIPVVFIDTAGLRPAGDELEQEGIRRSFASLEKADLVLHILDRSVPLASEDIEYLARFNTGKRILVLNKCDLPRHCILPSETTGAPLETGPQTVEVSCVTGAGIEHLKDAIKTLSWSRDVTGEMWEVMINSRHQEALARARDAFAQTLEGMNRGQTLEIVAMELRIGVDALGEIVGKTSTEDLLDSIFSQFCIGK
jgi:tRNA modification GTPase